MTPTPRLTPALAKRVEAALLSLQSALLGRSLYGPEHATLRDHLAHAAQGLDEVLQAAGPFRVVQIDDRVVVGSHRLEGSPRLVGGLFKVLRRHSADGFAVKPGVDSAELQALLDRLDDTAEDHETTASASRHDHVSTHVQLLRLDAEEVEPDADAPVTVLQTRQTVGDLAPVWTGIAEGRDLDPAQLGRLIDQISTAARLDGRAMLPLADLKSHDEYTYVHAVNVGILAGGLAQAVGLPAHTAYDLTLAAVLHDVGKREIPLDVLNKTGKLEEHELRIMRRHPVDGARALFDMPGIPEVAPVVAFEHHIYRDGSGYPHVRPGYTPHVASQIVQVADIFDALRTDRHYRKAYSVERARSIMIEGEGDQFDPDLLSVFFERVVTHSARDQDAAPRCAA